MEDLVVVQYEFSQRGLTICQHQLLEGAKPLTVDVKHSTGTVSIELRFEPVSDPETEVETLYPLADNRRVYSNIPIILVGEAIQEGDSFPTKKSKLFEGLTVKGKVLSPALQKREPRNDKLTCSDCVLWNREAGVEELEKITHIYQNGTGQMIKEICAAISAQHGKPMLTSKNVGYCPAKQALCGSTTPGCPDLEKILDSVEEVTE